MTSPDTEFISILGTAGSPEAPLKVSSRSLPETLPILGLSDIVIFPGMVAPLLVETAQSTKLIDDVVGGERLLGVVLQRNAEAENPLPHEMHEVGCAARVLKMLKFPDSTVRVLVEGLWRIRVKDYTSTAPYLCAKFELVKDVTEDSVELTAMMRNAQSQFQEIIKLSPALSEQIKIAALNTEDPGHFADLIAVNLNLDLAERQKLLETSSVKERLIFSCASNCAPSSASWVNRIRTPAKSACCAKKSNRLPCPKSQKRWLRRSWSVCSRCRLPPPNTG